MTSTIKTGLTIDTSAIAAGQTIDASDFITPHSESLTHHRAGRVSVTTNDTHVKHLFDALSAGTNISLTLANGSADESITIALTGTVAAAFGGLGADISGITGVLKLTAGVASAAVAGTDYITPGGTETLTNKTLDATNDVALNALDTGANPSSYVLAPDGSGGVTARAEGGGGAQPVDFTITAGETLAERDAVYLNDSDGKWYKIDMDASPLKCGRLRGIVNESGGIATDATGSIRILGEISGYSGLTAWSNVYASGTPGGLTQTRPNPTSGGVQVAIADMGWATSATAIMVAPDSVRYAKRATLTNDATITVEHHIDENGRNRIPRAFISGSGAGSSVVSYADSNQDDDVRVRLQTPATYTVDQCTGGTASANSDSNGAASQAFDDNDATDWATAVIAPPFWVEYDFGTDKTIRQYTVKASSSFPDRCIQDYQLEYWGGSAWQVADTQTGHTTWTASQQRTHDVASAHTSDRWRVYVTADNNTNTRVGEIEMMEAATFNSVTKLTQTFTVGSETDVDTIGLYLKKTGSPADTLTCRIETVSSNDPTGTLVDANATGTADESTLTTSYGEITFTLADTVTLAAGTYAIVLSSDGTTSDSDYVEWGNDTSSPGFSGGEMKKYNGSAWSALTADAIFTVYSPGTTYNEPSGIGRWSGGTRDFAVRYDDGSGSDANTKTTIKNTTGVSQDVTLEIEVA
ncbi:MAG: discoidin domain-containing protein [Aggregatilineales bacterium]